MNYSFLTQGTENVSKDINVRDRKPAWSRTVQVYTVLYVDYTAMKTGARTEWENLWDKMLS